MKETIYKSKLAEVSENSKTWAEKWSGKDCGLITCWEIGRKMANSDEVLVNNVKNNELPILPWKGGFVKTLSNQTNKFAPYYYLAMWQGIRGDDLNIDTSIELSMTCSKTNMTSVFTIDHSKYANR